MITCLMPLMPYLPPNALLRMDGCPAPNALVCIADCLTPNALLCIDGCPTQNALLRISVPYSVWILYGVRLRIKTLLWSVQQAF